MFKIAKANLSMPFVPGSLDVSEDQHDLLTQFCLSENWVADMSNGVINLGDRAARLHDLPAQECGLLSLIRSYEQQDRTRILELFEQAATTSSSFCFSTTIVRGSNHRQPLFCVGESTGLEQRFSGSMIGVFLFPRFQLDSGAQFVSRQ
ncbi:hypothetical protein MRS76_22935 [Rhizobiaceae bacterium n13]|uniref:Uncharacterized protein n=1 Tax=Ferirhizobium litorale TaxID=2927786 RepID=A0AAE3QB00_9HYPH|nr:hypothetical protein [Fererhizobium litorale]MDI7864788.1 hypothetical protein [Fererhizobium litorale]MDI7921700.1 hypothetical protein [Fererhizobium litorale]